MQKFDRKRVAALSFEGFSSRLVRFRLQPKCKSPWALVFCRGAGDVSYMRYGTIISILYMICDVSIIIYIQ